MIDLLKSYLVKLPTPTTAPLYQQLNTSQIKAALSSNGSITEVKCYSTSPDEQLPTVYVVLRELTNFQARLNPNPTVYQHNCRLEAVGLEIEVNSSGSTDTEALGRAELLRLEVDIFLSNNRRLILNGTNTLVRNPVNTGETTNFDKISNFFPVTTAQKGDAAGPTLNKTTQEWQCKRFVRCEVWVYRGR